MTNRTLPVGRLGLAGLLAAMAVGQASDFGGFVDIVAAHRVGGDGAAVVVALLLLSGEAVAAAGLFARSPQARRRGATGAVLVAAAWSLMASQAFARGLALSNCGCFGVHAAQRLRWWVLVEDVEFVAWAVWTFRRTRQPGAPRPRIRPEEPAAR